MQATNTRPYVQSNVTSRVLRAARQVLDNGITDSSTQAEQHRYWAARELDLLGPVSPNGVNQTALRPSTPQVTAFAVADAKCHVRAI